MTTKHTPGPWLATGWENTVVNIPDTHHGGHLTICVYPASGQAPRSEAVANARLIAAAPDMLEALKAIAEACEANADSAMGEGWIKAHEKFGAFAHAALAKATGKAA